MELPVIFEKTIFKHPRGFAIIAVTLNGLSSQYTPELEDIVAKNTDKNNYNNFPVTINMLDPDEKLEGRQVIVTGEFIKHPKYGKQFQSTNYYSDKPSNEAGLIVFLESLIHIKKVRSREIVKRFGYAETIRILDEEPNRLLEISHITANRVKAIKEAWDKEALSRKLSMWLGEHAISTTIAKKIYDKWGEDSWDILTENPYKLTEIKGFGFIRADEIAYKVLTNVPKDLRTVACMVYCLEENLNKNSNLCMPLSTLKINVIEELSRGTEQNNPKEEFIESEYKSLIIECIKKNLNLFVAVKDIYSETNGIYIYLKNIWEQEKYIAEQIYNRRSQEDHDKEEAKEVDFTNSSGLCNDNDLVDAEKDIEHFSDRKIVLDDCQKDAIKSAFEHKVTVITGAGGSGKSMICRCIFYLAQKKRLSIRMMSPTGKAAQVLATKTGYPAETIHRSLKLKPGDNHSAEDIKQDIIIIDESSMIGIDTMYAIMRAMEQNIWGHLVFVGDRNQLPSVSPGNFLFDMMESGCVNVVKLDKIHRQDEKSYIPLLANEISKGKIVEIPEDAADIKWHSLSMMPDFDVAVRDMVKNHIKNDDISSLQIISPMYKGRYGINQINDIAQNLIAETNGVKDTPFIHGYLTLYVGDRVIQLENNYDKEVFNGDMGFVVEIGKKIIDPEKSDRSQNYVVVNFYGRRVMYVNDEIEQLKLAWCVSVHKFQGSQSPNILFVMSNEASIMMNKELVYTAMTRAEKHLDIYGHIEMFKKAPSKSAIRLRYTNMKNIISELRENKKILKILE